MNFEILDKKDAGKVKFTVITLEKDCLKNIKQNLKDIEAFEIAEDVIDLKAKLYAGKGKTESIKLQKANCDKMLKLYKVCVKLIKMLKRKHVNFSGKFYVSNIDKKTNNNDFMIGQMLNVRFNVRPSKRLAASYKVAADYLDMENSINKMCDFHDNKCTKHRELNDDRTTGCCTKTICRYTCNAPCPTWNLACKIIMCDYIINTRGFYFTPHTVPILKKHFSPIERAYSIGQLCRSSKKAIFQLWVVRIGKFIMSLSILALIALFIFI